MKFVGSKARIAKDIVPIIQGYLQRGNYRAYVEPFVGGANIIQHIRHPIRLGYDSSKPLIDLLQYVLCGGKLPLTISKRMYDDVKAHPDDYDSWLVGAVGYLASYNGKYFGGYAGARLLKDRVTVRDYYDEAKRNLEKQVKDLREPAPVCLVCMDYRGLNDAFKDGLHDTLIYADPPYNGTTGYGGKFDSTQMWQTLREWGENNTVLVSELCAPNDFRCIWQKPVTRTLNKNGRHTAVEKLFIYEG